MSNASTRRVRALLLVLALGLIAAGVWYQGPDAAQIEGKHPNQTAQKSATADQGGALTKPSKDKQAPARLRCAFLPGQRLAFSATTDSQIHLDLAPALATTSASKGASLAATPPQDRRTVRAWTLELEALDTNQPDQSTVFAATIHSAQTQLLTGDFEGEPGDLSPVFLVRLSDRCAVLEYAWRFDADLNGAYNQQALVSTLQFWLPQSPQSLAYQESAFDFTGRYTARYSATRDKVMGTLSQYKRVFADPQGKQSAHKDTQIKHTSLSVTVGEDGWFSSLDSALTLALSMKGISIGFLKTSTHVAAVSPSDWASNADPSDPSWVWGLLLEQPAKIATKAPIRPELRGVSVDVSLARLRAILALKNANPAEYAAFMREWVRANPEQLPALLALIQAGEFTDEPKLRSVIFYALGAANTPEAKAVLMAVFLDPNMPEGYQVGAARALASSDPLPEGFVEALLTGAKDASNNHLKRGSLSLSIGTLAREQETLNPTAAQVARNTIKAMLASPEGDEHLAYSLQAAGNAGHSDLLPPIQAHLSDEDSNMRALSASALRNMPADSAALSVIEQAYLSESDASVRAQLLASAIAISAQADAQAASPTLVGALIQNLPSAEGAELAAAAQILGTSARQGDPSAAAALDAQLRSEIAKDNQNVERIQALAAHHNTRWTAQDLH